MPVRCKAASICRKARSRRTRSSICNLHYRLSRWSARKNFRAQKSDYFRTLAKEGVPSQRRVILTRSPACFGANFISPAGHGHLHGMLAPMSESPPLSQDLKRLHAPTRDLRLLSSIYTGEDLPPPILQSTAALGRRFATYEISKRHLRSTVQGSSDVA